jgi:hippurate hydrolase
MPPKKTAKHTAPKAKEQEEIKEPASKRQKIDHDAAPQ